MTLLAPPFPGVTPSGKPIVEIGMNGTITTGGTAQSLMSAPAPQKVRTGWWLQNQSSGPLVVVSSDRAAAATSGPPGILIAAGQLYECPTHMVSQGSYSIFGATTAQAWDGAQSVN